MNYQFYAKTDNVPPPVLKPFDLEIGDKVTYRILEYRPFNPKVGMQSDPTYNIWRVIVISNHIFVGQNRYGIRTAFRKNEYRLGEVVRYD